MKRALQLPQCPGCGTGWENTHVACRLLTWGDRDCHLGRPKPSPFSDRKEGRRPHRQGALEIHRGFSLNLQLRTNLHRLRVNLHKPGKKGTRKQGARQFPELGSRSEDVWYSMGDRREFSGGHLSSRSFTGCRAVCSGLTQGQLDREPREGQNGVQVKVPRDSQTLIKGKHHRSMT